MLNNTDREQDLLTNMNSYPFLDNKHKPIFDGDLADLNPRVRRERAIDITNAPTVAATKLRAKLEMLLFFAQDGCNFRCKFLIFYFLG